MNLSDRYIGISRTIAEAVSDMTITELKVLALAMSKIHYMADNNNATVHITKEEIIAAFGKENTSDRRTISDIRKVAESLCDCKIYPSNRSYYFEIMNIVDRARLTKGRNPELQITFTQSFMEYIQGFEVKNTPYITMSLDDVLGLPNTKIGQYAYNLYIYLRSHCDTRKHNTRDLSISDIKKVMGIPEDMYVRYTDNGEAIHNRHGLETKLLIPALQTLTETKHLKVLSSSSIFDRDHISKTHGQPIRYTIKYIIDTKH